MFLIQLYLESRAKIMFFIFVSFVGSFWNNVFSGLHNCRNSRNITYLPEVGKVTLKSNGNEALGMNLF
jgi:hypothetical protein